MFHFNLSRNLDIKIVSKESFKFKLSQLQSLSSLDQFILSLTKKSSKDDLLIIKNLNDCFFRITDDK